MSILVEFDKTAPHILRCVVDNTRQFLYRFFTKRGDSHKNQPFSKVIFSGNPFLCGCGGFHSNARSAPSNKLSHRYAGLGECGDCGSVFVPLIRDWNGNRRVESVCHSYHRGGKAICGSNGYGR